MNAIRFPWFRTGYVAAALCLTIGAACALPAPGLMRAFMTVGADVQLPLERVAADNPEPSQVTDLSKPLHTPALESGHTQSSVYSRQQSRHRADASARAPRHTPAYQRTITDFKYWT
ncbi:hypothetical protein [Paraburkholderia sp. SIMBA_030]|uniref:hypothetical protein n=1 Tax=Paraburkholderia sp. SIMBA_030 TaxID=3085773 RepID=UPI00397A4DF6